MKVGYTRDFVVCPFCYHKHEDYQNFTNPDDVEADFPLVCENEDCGKEFHVEMRVITLFKTSRL